MYLSKEDKKDISNSIKHLEKHSEAELVAVMAEKSGEYDYAWLVIGFFLVVIVSIFAITDFTISNLNLLVIQMTCMASFLALSFFFEGFLIKALPNVYKHKKASIHANKLFNQLGITRTKSHIGIMFFVSVSERYVEIVVDEGVKEKIDKSYWENVVANFIKSVKKDEFAIGYIQAINECSEILTKNFPIKSDDKNELPDEVIEV